MWRLLATLSLLVAVLAALIWRAPPRANLADFLPPGSTPASAFLFREIQTGAAATLLLVAIEGEAPRAELARLSRETAAALRASARFAFVGDGTLRPSGAEEEWLFRHRYLLSPDTRPETFTAPSLRPRLEGLLEGLRTAASPLLVRYGFSDPTGAFLALAESWLGGSGIETFEGAWFAAPREGRPPRALIVARAAGAGLDSEAGAGAVATIRAAFVSARPPAEARLLVSGPGVFAAEAAATIQADVGRVTVASGLLLAAFLVWRFRSLLLLGLVAVPLLAATVAGYAATVAGFGSVHAIALGFGMTMLGVAVDYPILLLTLRRGDESAGQAAARIWPALRLAAAAAAAGLLAMIGSGLPGFAQLGVFAGVGLLTAAGVTRWVLPALVPAGAEVAARRWPRAIAAPLMALRGRPLLGVLAMLAALAGLVLAGAPPWQRDLAALSPVPAAQQALDGELRAQLGAPDVRGVVLIGPALSEAEMLRRAEALDAATGPLIARGLLGRLDLPSRVLPSPEAQQARQAALPDRTQLELAVREAAAGLPFRPTAFAPFLAAVEESRTLPPIDLAALERSAPVVAARVSPAVSRHDGAVWGVAPAAGVADPAGLERAIAALGVPGVLFLDVKVEMERLLAAYAGATALWAAAGSVGVMGLLALGLGGAGPALRVAAPICGAVLVAVAGLRVAGEALSLFHLASLLLLAGLAIDYSLFLARSGTASNDEGQVEESLGAVLSCAVSTLLTFGLLSLCETPVLHGIGLTVAIGVTAAFLLALTLAPRGVAR